MHHNWTNDEQSALVSSMATRLVQWTERSLEGWKAAFRNISGQFAQLNWTTLLVGRSADRDAERTTLAPKAIER